MIETANGFRKLKAHKQLPAVRAALIARHERSDARSVAKDAKAA